MGGYIKPTTKRLLNEQTTFQYGRNRDSSNDKYMIDSKAIDYGSGLKLSAPEMQRLKSGLANAFGLSYASKGQDGSYNVGANPRVNIGDGSIGANFSYNPNMGLAFNGASGNYRIDNDNSISASYRPRDGQSGQEKVGFNFTHRF